MARRQFTVDEIIESARQLSPVEKVRLVARVMSDIEVALEPATTAGKPLRSAYGLCRDLGPAPSEDEIDEARRELFESFPRVDIS